MSYIYHNIVPELSDLVSCMIHIQQDLAMNKDIFYFHPATPQTGICFHFQDRIFLYDSQTQQFVKQPQTIVVGPQIKPVWLHSPGNYRTVRVGLLPGALYRLTGIPQNQLIDQGIDAELIFGSEIKVLNQALLNSTSPQCSLLLIEQFLIKQIANCKNQHHLDRVMRMLCSDYNFQGLDQLAMGSCLSTRQFERICQQRIGMHPKLYHRIIRFSKTFQMLEQGYSGSWTNLAYMNNYFDRQHLKRDFKLFTGMNLMDLHMEIQNTPFLIQGKLSYT